MKERPFGEGHKRCQDEKRVINLDAIFSPVIKLNDVFSSCSRKNKTGLIIVTSKQIYCPVPKCGHFV